MTAVVQRLTADNAVLLAGKLQAIQSLDKLRIEVEALNKQVGSVRRIDDFNKALLDIPRPLLSFGHRWLDTLLPCCIIT